MIRFLILSVSALLAPSYAHSAASFDPKAIIANLEWQISSFKKCHEDETVNLGRTNNEDSGTILRAVDATCMGAETKLREAYAQTPFDRNFVETRIATFRREAQNNGVAALLKIRAAR